MQELLTPPHSSPSRRWVKPFAFRALRMASLKMYLFLVSWSSASDAISAIRLPFVWSCHHALAGVIGKMAGKLEAVPVFCLFAPGVVVVNMPGLQTVACTASCALLERCPIRVIFPQVSQGLLLGYLFDYLVKFSCVFMFAPIRLQWSRPSPLLCEDNARRCGHLHVERCNRQYDVGQ
jgi:hypothetical protein